MNYISKLPAVVPVGMVLVHNQVKPVLPLGRNGFRAWLAADTTGLEVCPCAFAPKLGTHYRVTAAWKKINYKN